MFEPPELPRYMEAKKALVGFYAGCILLTGAIGVGMWLSNRGRDRAFTN